jgi:hypothetical protein
MNGKAHATIGLFAGPATGLVLPIEADGHQLWPKFVVGRQSG